MINHLRGTISDLTPNSMVVECSGVGYLLNISLNTYRAYSGRDEGKVLVSQIIRDNEHLLFGFSSEEEREFFLLLIGISGVGPNTARIILSSHTPRDLHAIVSQGKVEPLKAIKGIGLKTAQRIILELKGKVQLQGDELPSHQALATDSLAPTISIAEEEAIAALKVLGYPEAATVKVVRAILSENPSLSVDKVVRAGLRAL